MALLASDIIVAALYEINELAPGETPNADDLTTGLAQLNALIDSWDIIRLNIFAIDRNVYSLTSSASFTLGPSGSLATTRPISIRQANIITAGDGLYIPLDIVDEAKFSSILERAITGKVPRVLYYDGKFPLGTIYLSPIPSNTPSIELFTWEPLAQLATAGTTFSMPPGYQLALELNLAVQLAPIYGRTVGPELGTNAMEAMAALRGENAPNSLGKAQEGQASGSGEPQPPQNNNAKP